MKFYNIIWCMLLAILPLLAACENSSGQPKNKTDYTAPSFEEEDPLNPKFPKCGNGRIDLRDGEECDGENLNGKNCYTLEQGYASGRLTCNENCHFDTVECRFAVEQCVGALEDYPTEFRLEDGMPCNFHYDCLSGFCKTYRDEENGTISRYCGDTVKTALKNRDNYPCWFDAECQSGYCWHGRDLNICASACDDSTVNIGPYTCQDDPQSLSGRSCLPENHSGEGAPCNNAVFDCAKGLYCILGYCTKECQRDDECKSGFCMDETPIYPAVCLAQALELNVEDGGACYDDYHCKSENCIDNFCMPTGERPCTGPRTYNIDHIIEDGHPCNISSDCKSGTCNEEGICGPVGTPYKNSSKLPNGYPCLYNTDCRSGICHLYAADLSICAKDCTAFAGDSNVYGYFDCEQQLGENNLWVCVRNDVGSGNLGDTCLSSVYDCLDEYVCKNGQCSPK